MKDESASKTIKTSVKEIINFCSDAVMYLISHSITLLSLCNGLAIDKTMAEEWMWQLKFQRLQLFTCVRTHVRTFMSVSLSRC